MGVIKYTEDFIKNFVEETGYLFLGFDENGYNGVKSKIIVWCKNPNHKPYRVSFENFKGKGKNKGTRCKQCYEENRFWSEEKIIKYIENNGYKVLEILSGYGQNTRLKIWCGNLNHEPYEICFANFKGRSNRKGNRCPKCSLEQARINKTIWTEENIKLYVENRGYIFIKIVEYNYNKSKILIWCGNKAHEYWETRFDTFYSGYNCPQCNESRGEKEVEAFLNKYSIDFKVQYIFNDCKFYKHLPFDFYLPKYNCCIEYDGEQHFKIVKWFGGLDGFIDRKIRDTVKNEYCKSNNIKIIRIPYYSFNNIENILIKELKLNKIKN